MPVYPLGCMKKPPHDPGVEALKKALLEPDPFKAPNVLAHWLAAVADQEQKEQDNATGIPVTWPVGD